MTVIKQIAKRQKTCKIILLALAELLDEVPLEKVKASDVIERAHCSRSTFYRHYESVGALYIDLHSVIVEKVIVISQSIIDAKSIKHPCRVAAWAIDHLEKDDLLFRRLCGFADSAQFSAELKRGLVSSCLGIVAESEQYSDGLGFQLKVRGEVSAVVDMLSGWLRGDYGELSSGEMKAQLTALDEEGWMVSE